MKWFQSEKSWHVASYILFYVLLPNILSKALPDESNELAHDNMFDSNYMPVKHKDLFPLDASDYWGTVLVSLGLMIAASGGIGGGGILVPLLILVYGFQPKHAVALSNFTILGSSLMNMILNVTKHHPFANRPLVDWDLILVMEPLTMAGAVIGAIVGKILPDWILTLALVVLLAQTTYTTLDKARSQYMKETKNFAINANNRSGLSNNETTKSILTQTIEDDEEAYAQEGLLNDDDEEEEIEDVDHQDGTKTAHPGGANNNSNKTATKTPTYRDRSNPDSNGDSNSKGNNKSSNQQLQSDHTNTPDDDDDDFNDDATLLHPQNKDTINNSKQQQQQQSAVQQHVFETDIFEKDIHIQGERSDDDIRQQQLRQLLQQESHTPSDRVYVMSMMVFIVVGLNLIKGGGVHFPSVLGITCGSTAYWMMTIMIIGFILIVSSWARKQLIDKWLLKKKLRHRYQEGDVEWNHYNTVIYPCICFFAGFFAGMFGIGGGVVKGPLMLQMGVHPLVASATVAVMIMFTSVSATAMFVAFGTLTWDYAWFLFLIGLISTVIGQFGVSYFVDKYKRYSFISMSIGAVVAISTVLMGLQSLFELIDPEKETGVEGTNLC